MKPADRRGARRQRGFAAVELALLLPVLIVMLAYPLYLGRVFWHYTVLHNVVQNTARYVSKIPVTEMNNANKAEDFINGAVAIAEKQLGELAPGGVKPRILITCDGGLCLGNTRPTVIKAHSQVVVDDIFFSGDTLPELVLIFDITYPYTGK